ncbi:hypothetical protein Aduo_010536 [Ancylostoma duodenale]
MRFSLSWDTWDVDERFVKQIIEVGKVQPPSIQTKSDVQAAHRRAGKVVTEEEKARHARQMRNAERVKELALIISKKNNSVAERVRCYIRHSQEVEEDIRKLTQKMNEEMDPAKKAALQAEIQRLKKDFDMKLVQRRQLLHNDLCTYFPLSEITRLEHSIEKLRRID